MHRMPTSENRHHAPAVRPCRAHRPSDPNGERGREPARWHASGHRPSEYRKGAPAVRAERSGASHLSERTHRSGGERGLTCASFGERRTTPEPRSEYGTPADTAQARTARVRQQCERSGAERAPSERSERREGAYNVK